MIQRIQTVYLFLSTAVMASMLFLPLAEMIDATGQFYVLDLYGLKEAEKGTMVLPLMPLTFLVSVAAAVSFITIFFYRNRIMQLRLCIFNILLQIGYYPLFFYYYYQARNQIEAMADIKISVVFPVISIILVFLATRNIRKDELLVRSYERLR